MDIVVVVFVFLPVQTGTAGRLASARGRAWLRLVGLNEEEVQIFSGVSVGAKVRLHDFSL